MVFMQKIYQIMILQSRIISIFLLFNECSVSASDNLRQHKIKIEPTCEDVGSLSFGMCMMHLGYGVVNGTCQGIGGCGASDEYTFFDEVDDCNDSCKPEKARNEVKPTCEDVSSISFGMCRMHLGYGVINGTCQGIGGCGSDEYTFFDEVEDCIDSCKPEKARIEVKPTCEDVDSISFGKCRMHLGYGVINGTCQGIGGCGSDEYTFFDEVDDCNDSCKPENARIEVKPTCEDVGSISFGMCRMHLGYGVINGTCQGVGGCGSDEYIFFDEVDDCKESCRLKRKREYVSVSLDTMFEAKNIYSTGDTEDDFISSAQTKNDCMRTNIFSIILVLFIIYTI